MKTTNTLSNLITFKAMENKFKITINYIFPLDEHHFGPSANSGGKTKKDVIRKYLLKVYE